MPSCGTVLHYGPCLRESTWTRSNLVIRQTARLSKYKASLVSVHDAEILSSNGCAYLLRFLRIALGMMTHTANSAANATPPSNTSISTCLQKIVNAFYLQSILGRACFNCVAQMLNYCYNLFRASVLLECTQGRPMKIHPRVPLNSRHPSSPARAGSSETV